MKELFKIGDRVRVYGHWQCKREYFNGAITHIGKSWVTVKSDEMVEVTTVHPKQCRRLRPKKKRVKREVTFWMNLYPGSVNYFYDSYDSYEQAKSAASIKCIATVKLTGSYYVEE